MSNNKQSMKIYTEEQMRKALRTYLDLSKFLTESDVIKEFTPIELPSDEEIREERLLQFPDSEYTNRANDRLAFLCGARFVINKIQGGNNEQQ